uniref:SET domain-containing protein 4 n=1 Tax=Diabrotica virgifera virgifera TaxID=50390 RepID=A0A6P7FEE7_DIAVI
MGRTLRQRLKKQSTKIDAHYNNTIVNLQKWMAAKGWKNKTKLRIRVFPQTGRGISSRTKIPSDEVLISIPLDAMITYNTLASEMLINEKLTIHEYLALFLAMEANKGSDSKWFHYIKSLPEETPSLPWLAMPKEIRLFPVDFQTDIDKNITSFNTFCYRIQNLRPNVCSAILETSLLKWAFIMVNTRAVHVDPNIISNNCSNVLLDEPYMALCPFLDMFNHHYLAKTEASIRTNMNSLTYELRTSTEHKRHDQIFISYGPHDNFKLLSEYGFFISKNQYDVVKFSLKEVIDVLKFQLDERRYRFIKKHNLQKNLYIGYDGVSFNLKAVLFVGSVFDHSNINSIVFSDSYPEQFLNKVVPLFVGLLIDFSFEKFDYDFNRLKDAAISSDSAKMVKEYLNYRLNFLDDLRKNIV